MTTANSLSKWQAFMWLWRYDPEARGFWFIAWLSRSHLKYAVQDNLKDFGVCPRV